MPQSLMNTREVADYLRIKERKVYDLVAQRRIPCTRAAGKWLFPKELIDQWLIHSAEGLPSALPTPEPPTILSGSHDPLLDWGVRESDCGLAVLFNGSLDGLERFAAGDALACGLHVLDAGSGGYNTHLFERRFATEPVVAIEWAWREQGLIVAKGNPLNLQSITDILDKAFAMRQKEAGSHVLLDHLLQQAGLDLTALQAASAPLRSENEVAMAIASGQAQAGLGVAAAAFVFNLDFVPLARERYDLLVRRRQYFSPAFQKLLAFTRQASFQERAESLGGYDIGGIGQVRYNAPV